MARSYERTSRQHARDVALITFIVIATGLICAILAVAGRAILTLIP